MNIDLLENNYLVVPEFISKQEAKKIEKEFFICDSVYKFSGDPQAPNSASLYNYLPALEILANKTSTISELVGETVLPTYTYGRIYRENSDLEIHTDRPACEISVTLHIGGDKPWAIWIKTPENENRCVNLNPGDAMIYLGCIAPHWRDEYLGKNYTQFFLHYVRSRGLFANAYFDKEKDVCENMVKLKGEYRTMRLNHNTFEPNRIQNNERKFDIDEQKEQTLRKFGRKSNIEEVTPSPELIEVDDTVVVNKKYQKFLKRKDSNKVEKSPEVKRTSGNPLSERNLKEFIFIKQNALDVDFCDMVIDEYEESSYWESTLTGSGHDPSARNCSVISISSHDIINENEEKRKCIDDEFFESVAKIIEDYHHHYPDFNPEIKEDTGYELLRYHEGEFYVQHTDSFKESPRALSVIFALNDDFDGGEICFFNRELKFKLNAGDAIVFPSNFLYPHEILKVTKGTRYSCLTWVV